MRRISLASGLILLGVWALCSGLPSDAFAQPGPYGAQPGPYGGQPGPYGGGYAQPAPGGPMQGPGDQGGHGGRGGRRGGWGGRRGGMGGGGDFMKGMLDRIDENHNGLIEQSEVESSGRRKRMFEGMVQGAGIELKYPMKVDDVHKRVTEHMQKNGPAWGSRPGGPGGPGAPGAKPEAPKKPEPAPETRKVAGFGADSASRPSTSGFGATTTDASGKSDPKSASKDSAKKDEKNAKSKNKEESKDGLTDRQRARLRRLAQSTLTRYDDNKSGRLERPEWSDQHERFKTADTDNNGILTLDELTNWLTEASRPKTTKKKEEDVPRRIEYSSSPSVSSPAGPRPGRFLTATERLPAELPSWFIQKDANGDGQVSMAEYATYWTRDKATEFSSYDLNNDGIITPQEGLAAK
ncbi:MAG: hypothetical protein JW818_00425 [Pirellulales bacterium]|nr:hypothetical protein [Pirellulales bacterium]